MVDQPGLPWSVWFKDWVYQQRKPGIELSKHTIIILDKNYANGLCSLNMLQGGDRALADTLLEASKDEEVSVFLANLTYTLNGSYTDHGDGDDEFWQACGDREEYKDLEDDIETS
ncbi:MAG: hypothetical protein MMC23_003385 [Stictis urceolatum]|nr:hypothetical protein [Stictis urceolata]